MLARIHLSLVLPFLSFTLWSEGMLESKIYVPQTNSYYTISNVVLDMGTQSTPP